MTRAIGRVGVVACLFIAASGGASFAQQRAVGAPFGAGLGSRGGVRAAGAIQAQVGAPKADTNSLVQVSNDRTGRTSPPLLFLVNTKDVFPQIFFRADYLIDKPPAAVTVEVVFCPRGSSPNECIIDLRNPRENGEVTRLKTDGPAWDALLLKTVTLERLAHDVGLQLGGCYVIVWRTLVDNKKHPSMPLSLHSGGGSNVCP